MNDTAHFRSTHKYDRRREAKGVESSTDGAGSDLDFVGGDGEPSSSTNSLRPRRAGALSALRSPGPEQRPAGLGFSPRCRFLLRVGAVSILERNACKQKQSPGGLANGRAAGGTRRGSAGPRWVQV